MPPGNDKDSGLSPEITRLSAILARDPNSKLFIALAEEYMKAGMAQEAVLTLEGGLKASPYYMSARVMLGKAYLETGDAYKAREQFEMVVKSVPDNLLAHKKLGEIYRMQGKPADAARSLRMVTLLNPRDAEARKMLAELESATATAPPDTREPSGEMEVESHIQGSAPGGSAPRPEPADMPEFDLAESLEDVPDAETAGPGPDGVYELTPPSPDKLDVEPDVIEMPVPDNMATLEEIPYAVEADLAEEPESMPRPEGPAPSGEEDEAQGAHGETAGYGLTNRGELEDIFASYQDALPGEDGKPGAEGVYEIQEDISAFEMEGVKIEPARKEPFETETLAELYISQGFYDRAINIYKNLLMEIPDDGALKQKLEDLYLLASMNSANAVAGAGTEAVDFEETEEAELQEAAEAGRTDIDYGAIMRLEEFLGNIRRKAGR